MNETLELICTEYFNTKKLLEEARKAKILAEAYERDKPVNIVLNVFFVLSVIGTFVFIFLNNRWHYYKSIYVGAITRTPIIPFSQEKSKRFKGYRNLKNVIPDARVLCAGENTATSLTCMRVNEIMRDLFNLRPQCGDDELTKNSKIDPVPQSAETISIKMEGFEHGKLCHDFVPIGGMAPGSYFTYQMYGDNRLQVTRYVENEVSFVAGFCIYVRDPKFSLVRYWGVEFPRGVIGDCMHSQAYPGRQNNVMDEDQETRIVNEEVENEGNQKFDGDVPDEEQHQDDAEERLWVLDEDPGEADVFPSFGQEPVEEDDVANLTVKYCPANQRILITKVGISGVVIHKEWDPISGKIESWECQECTEQRRQNEEEEQDDEPPPPYSSIILV